MQLVGHPLPKGTFHTTQGFTWDEATRTGHPGRDDGVIVGVPLRAPVDGHVTQAWDPFGGGYWTNLYFGPNDWMSFGHASAYFDPDGPGPLTSLNGFDVKAGDILCYTGNTGHSTGPHVHTEIRFGGRRVDPGPYLDDCIANDRFFGPDNLPPEAEMATPLTENEKEEIAERAARKVAEILSGRAQTEGQLWAQFEVDGRLVPYTAWGLAIENQGLANLGMFVNTAQLIGQAVDREVAFDQGHARLLAP